MNLKSEVVAFPARYTVIPKPFFVVRCDEHFMVCTLDADFNLIEEVSAIHWNKYHVRRWALHFAKTEELKTSPAASPQQGGRMSKYAKGTQVSVERSKAEIERTLARYGADQFIYGWRDGAAIIGFRAHERMIRFELLLPDKFAKEFTHSSVGRRSEDTIAKMWEQSCRQRWRALALVVKAKLEAVASGITTFENEFLAHTVLPDGRTFSQWAQPQLESAYASGGMPALIPAPSAERT